MVKSDFRNDRRLTRSTAKSRRQGRKKAKGRKGTIDEYTYLLSSLTRLVVRLEEKTTEIEPFLLTLIVTSNTYREMASDLESKVKTLREKINAKLEEAWLFKVEVDDAKKKATGEEDAPVAWAMLHRMNGHMGGASVAEAGAPMQKVEKSEEERHAEELQKQIEKRPEIKTWSGKVGGLF